MEQGWELGCWGWRACSASGIHGDSPDGAPTPESSRGPGARALRMWDVENCSTHPCPGAGISSPSPRVLRSCPTSLAQGALALSLPRPAPPPPHPLPLLQVSLTGSRR